MSEQRQVQMAMQPGGTGKITVGGVDLSKFVNAIRVNWSAGPDRLLPEIELGIAALDGVTYEGPALVHAPLTDADVMAAVAGWLESVRDDPAVADAATRRSLEVSPVLATIDALIARAREA